MIGVSKTLGYFLLEKVVAAGDEPEMKTHNTDLIKRTMLKEGL